MPTERPAASNPTASASNKRAPRATADREQSAGQLHRIGIRGARRHDRAGPRDAEDIQQHRMVEKIARQACAFAKLMLFLQFPAGAAGREIQRIACRASRKAVRAEAPATSGRRRHADWRDRPATPARNRRAASSSVSERSISHSSIEVEAAVLPRPGSSRSMTTTSRPWRVRRSASSDPVMPPPTIKRVASDVLVDIETQRMSASREPRRTTAAKIGLFGVVCVETGNDRPQVMDRHRGCRSANHGKASSSYMSSCSSRTGSLRMRWPVAWKIALQTAALVPTLPSSPMPLTPAGLM